MGRGRGKGKKLTVVASHEELGSGGEESLTDYKGTGEPEMPMKDDDNKQEENVAIKADETNIKPILVIKDETAQESGKKRKRHLQVKENSGAALEENGSIAGSKVGETAKTVGYRQTGSRRKSKPHRAAEAVVPVMAVYKGI